MCSYKMNMVVQHTIIAAACFMGCIFLYACENDPAKVNHLNKKSIGIEEAKDVVLNYTIGGKTKSILKAPLMLNVQTSNPYVEFPKTLHADFYNEAGVMESFLNARYGKYKQSESIIFLKDSVVVINTNKGDTLYCNELFWDRNKPGTEFYTDKPVRIRTKTETINGLGMEASQNFKNWHILHSVGSISVPASKFPN